MRRISLSQSLTTLGGILLVISVCLICQLTGHSPARAAQQDITVEQTGPFELVCEFSCSPDDLSIERGMAAFHQISLTGCDVLSPAGSPRLPSREILVALPPGMRVVDISQKSIRTIHLEGTWLPQPAQPPLPVSSSRIPPFTGPDPTVYSRDEPYPETVVELVGQVDLAGQAMAVVLIHPLQYRPAGGRLDLHERIFFTLAGTGGYVCGDYLPSGCSERTRKQYQDMLRDLVVNPEATEPRSAETRAASRLPDGDYEYVIITNQAGSHSFEPLAAWKTRKGVPAVIVTTEWIETTYNGGNDLDEDGIRDFVIDAFSAWGTTYFLLGGDMETVPCHRYYFEPYVPTYNDTYYADFDGDRLCEVFVGRASVDSLGQIDSFISKNLNYERSAASTGHADRAALFGFDLNYDTPGEVCKADIDDLYFADHFQMTTVYYSDPGYDHEARVAAAIEEGQNLMNHIGHGTPQSVSMGATSMTIWEVDRLQNDVFGLFYSIACHACGFQHTDCFAERMVGNTHGGSLAFIGNTLQGWYTHGEFDTLSMRYDRCFWRSLFDRNNYHLGCCFTEHKNSGQQFGNEHSEMIFTELTLLGDPELPLWTSSPEAFDQVLHPETIGCGTQPFVVRVVEQGLPVPGALVCVMKDQELYERCFTDALGQASLVIEPLSDGVLDVTVTAQNFFPRESSCVVTSGSVPRTIEVQLAATPVAGELPLSTTITGEIGNLSPVHRRVAARLDLKLSNGTGYTSYRRGWTNLAPGETHTEAWTELIPLGGSTLGLNRFTLSARDVTPPPYNLPPYPPAGDTATASCTVEGMDPVTWYVDWNNCPGPGSGTADDPFCTIGEGLAQARNGDLILVADGTYSGEGNVDLDFAGKAVILRSMGGPDVCIIECGGDDDPHRGFSFTSGEDEHSVLEGFTIQNARADQGGGILCHHASPTLLDLSLIHCHANDGGGICCIDASPCIISCYLGQNRGSGIHCEASAPLIFDCYIYNNFGAGGGGICCVRSSPAIINNLVCHNAGYYRGGGIYCWDSAPTITNTTLRGNQVVYEDQLGGGLYCWNSAPVLTDCILWDSSPVEVFVEAGDDPQIIYSDVQGGYPGEGNLDADPLFVYEYQLSQIASGQAQDSLCVDAGSNPAAAVCFSILGDTICMNQMTTRTDGQVDQGTLDIGYHHRCDDDGESRGHQKMMVNSVSPAPLRSRLKSKP